MRRYKQLTMVDREDIYRLLEQGKTQAEIAKALRRSKSTIGREIKRNWHQKFDEYLPDTAERKATKRKTNGRKERYVDRFPLLKAKVLKKLKQGWSPDIIAGKLRDVGHDYLTKESIYQFIYSLEGRKQNLRQHLPYAHRIRRKRNGRKHTKGTIPGRVDISFRPQEVENRMEFGHWEGDTVSYQGHSQRLATHVERKTRYLVVLKPSTNKAKERAKLITECFSKLPQEARKTMTFDNGLEFAEHQRITNQLGTQVYFAKPYSSWQRGSNENANGILRRHLPRCTDINELTGRKLSSIINKINNRPRKILNYKTPAEVFKQELLLSKLPS